MNEELKVIISAEIGNLKKSVQEAKGEFSKFAKDVATEGTKAYDGFQKVGDGAKKALKVAATAVAGAATALIGLSAATSEYRTAQAKLNTAFESAGGSAETAKQTYNDLYRVLGDTDVAVEAANHLAKLTTNEKELSEWTNICQGVYATFGDSLPIEGLTEAANETAKVGTLTGSLADALNWAGVNEEDFQAKLDACASAQEREALIRETLNGLYSDAAAGYEENAASLIAQNEANAKMAESMARVGEAVEPVKVALTELGAQILSQLAPYIEDFAANHLPKIVSALGGMGDAIGKVFKWISDHWTLVTVIAATIGTITVAIAALSTGLSVYNTVMAITSVVSAPVIGIIAGIVAAIAAVVAIIVVAVKHWDEITAAVGNFAKKVGEWLSDLWDNITQWFSDVVDGFQEWWDGLVEGFSEWWNNLIEGFAQFFTNIWDAISTWWTDLTTGFSEFFSGIWESISEWWSNLTQGFSDFFSNIWSAISDWWGNLKQGWSDSWQNTKDKVSEGVTNVKDKFNEMKEKATETFNQFKENAKNKFEEIKNNIKDKTENARQIVSEKYNQVKETMSTVMEAAKNTVKQKLDNIKNAYNENGGGIKGIAAGAMEAVKGYWTAGLTFVDTLTGGKLSNIAESFRSKLNSAKETVSSVLNSIKDKFNSIMENAKSIVSGAIEKIKSFFNFSWSLPKIKLPHFSISGSFSLNPPSIPHFSVSWYQHGGVFDFPTLFPYGGKIGGLGENGAEAIVPLEKNTQWLDRIAERLDRNSGRPIYLTVDGKVFAQVAVDSINDLTTQTGSLPLKFA